jgi:hypothetical protein
MESYGFCLGDRGALAARLKISMVMRTAQAMTAHLASGDHGPYNAAGQHRLAPETVRDPDRDPRVRTFLYVFKAARRAARATASAPNAGLLARQAKVPRGRSQPRSS